jgi:hypothetical protein
MHFIPLSTIGSGNPSWLITLERRRTARAVRPTVARVAVLSPDATGSRLGAGTRQGSRRGAPS